MKRAYLPEESLWGYRTVVTDKSVKGLPSSMDREQEINLPAGSATPKTPQTEDMAEGLGRVLSSENSPAYNVPGTGEPGPAEHPRTIGEPGDDSPTKFDYNMPTRRTMTGYEARIPWRKQRRQRIWDRLRSKREYQKHKSKIKHRVKIWYKKVRTNRHFQTKRQDRRDNPKKHERRRMGLTMPVAYTPSSLSSHRRRQHGPARVKSHRHYMHNRAKAQRRHHLWYQRNKNKPAFRKRVLMRRRHPQQFHLRPGAYVPGKIQFIYGFAGQLGYVNSMSVDAIVFSPVIGEDPTNPEVLTPAAFLHAVIFDSEESMHRFFQALDTEIGLTAYEDLTVEDVYAIANLYAVPVPDLMSVEPGYLSGVADQMVADAMASWAEPSAMAMRVAKQFLAGDVVLYDQGRDQDMAIPLQRTLYDHNPVPGNQAPIDESGVDFPASSGKVIPDTLRTAATIEDIEKHVSTDIVQRSRSVKPHVAHTVKGVWTFHVAGSKSEKYTVHVKLVDPSDIQRSPVKVSCNCDFFQFQGSEYHALTHGFLYGKPQGTATAPKQKDMKGKHWVCKHILACLNQIREAKV